MKNFDSEERPWGRFDVLSREMSELGDVVIKKISVKPGKRLSYQSHENRDEHWFIVSGTGVVILDGVERGIKTGDSVDVRHQQKHRIGNTGNEPLVFIEISTGKFDEEDITRFEDDFGRAG